MLEHSERVERAQDARKLRAEAERIELRDGQRRVREAEGRAEVDRHELPAALVDEVVVEVAVADAEHVPGDGEGREGPRELVAHGEEPRGAAPGP